MTRDLGGEYGTREVGDWIADGYEGLNALRATRVLRVRDSSNFRQRASANLADHAQCAARARLEFPMRRPSCSIIHPATPYSSSNRDIVFLSAVRTPFGTFVGPSRTTTAVDLTVEPRRARSAGDVAPREIQHSFFAMSSYTVDTIYFARHSRSVVMPHRNRR